MALKGLPGVKWTSSHPEKSPVSVVSTRVLDGQVFGGGGALLEGSVARRDVVANCASFQFVLKTLSNANKSSKRSLR